MTPAEKVKQAQDILVARQLAYSQTFAEDNQAAQRVLRDLAKFCRAHKSTFDPDPRIAAMLDGRREVFLRILKYTQLSTTDLFKTQGVPE